MKTNYLILQMFSLIFALVYNPLISSGKTSDICQKWSTPKTFGYLDNQFGIEVSGIVFSKTRLNIIYYHNDSGDEGAFYEYNLDLKKVRKIKINGYNPKDFEDIAQGACPHDETKNCLYLGDIGDNKRVRDFVQIVIVEENNLANRDSVTPVKILKLYYPDKAHNSEGIAINPVTQDLVLLTKEERSPILPSIIFKIPRNKIMTETVINLSPSGEINLPVILKNDPSYAQVVTGFDISPDGKSYLLLTYINAVEIDSNLKSYKIIPLTELWQQEAITYYSESDFIKSFVYTTEIKNSGLNNAPILKVDCLD